MTVIANVVKRSVLVPANKRLFRSACNDGSEEMALPFDNS